jgi:pyruvate/2-oxoglutarate dehydrogenase complex dihydrolipoamide dehydrogenase (E3) component
VQKASPPKGSPDDSVARPTSDMRFDLCVIGGGSGGLSVAAAAASFGQKVVLIERHKMGGDCLNYGCVPSKALIAAANRAHAMRSSAAFGIAPATPAVSWSGVNDHVKSVIAAIAPNDSVERFRGLGVHVIEGTAKFRDAESVVAGDTLVRARRFIVATGSQPLVPPIPGLAETPFFTNETLFDNREPIGHLIVIGGGPIGMEMAQAHLRLGAKVTVLEGAKALGKDDPEMTAVLLKSLRAEGLVIREGAKVVEISGVANRVSVKIEVGAPKNSATETVEGTHLLVAVGRKPNIANLGLEAGGIKHGRSGIEVGADLLTSNRKVFAIGDCIGGYQFTHVANYHAGIVIRRALFRLPAKADAGRIPWVTYTAPELANVGITEAQAAERKISVRVLRWPFHENDRAQAERETEGHVKVITDRRGVILGASIVGAHAGELIQVWSLAVAQRMKIKAMTDWIAPYPTLGEISKRAAYRFFSSAPGNPMVRRAIGFLAKFG